MEKIDIVIPNYRDGEKLVRLIKSIEIADNATQIINTIYIVENGPDKKKLVLTSSTFKIKYLRSRPNSLSAARNLGTIESKAEWILYLDDDVWLDANYFESIRKALSSENFDIAIGPVELESIETLPSWVSHTGATLLCNFNLGSKNRFVHEPGIGANMLFKRKIVFDLGLFREDLGRNGKSLLSNEDTDFFLKAIQEKHRIFYIAGMKAHHELHSDRVSYKWFLERMAWQGISDYIMGQRLDKDAILDPKNNEYARIREIINYFLIPPSTKAELDKKLEEIRLLSQVLASMTSIRETNSDYEKNDLFFSNHNYRVEEKRLFNSKHSRIVFIEFGNHHSGNYEYVYSNVPDSGLQRIETDAWLDPYTASLELSAWMSTFSKQVTEIVFLTVDPIFWNWSIFEPVLKLHQIKFRYHGIIHRQNREIINGAKKIGQIFHHLTGYGTSILVAMNGNGVSNIESSPIPSFNETHFKILKREKTYNSEIYTLGLIGEFRLEKNYAFFISALKEIDSIQNVKIKVLLAGRNRDNARDYIEQIIRNLNIEIEILDEYISDRKLIELIARVDLFISPYDKFHQISASGPVAEALSLGTPILIDPESSIGKDLSHHSTNFAFSSINDAIKAKFSDRKFNSQYVSSAGAVDHIYKATRE